ncbi:hypothetical protein AX768_25105 [Burkholderia sp. PAMC 28687]|uniref:hypothetical protein n=1 Tax=Burkholderia sp. PAMC 28687 TaxID=1795874 RepID=UPI0007851A5B|nr:hypothetical protein [Burkholderia sp. PAMC 28687]AMM17483.1 hypothetical protein AX768_25105 [Burkholderia sp. PAMC 28687]
MRRKALLSAMLCVCITAGGCSAIGPKRLKADQVDYARALGEAKKREILAALVGIRFADSPAFLSVTQIIAAYTFDATAGSTFSAGDTTQNFAAATGSVSYSNHPTFTFTPTTGQAFATAYIRPLAPGLVLPLAESAIPIDLLLRITAQSIGGLQNANAMGGPNANGSVGFFELIQAFRRLQLAGQLNVETRDEDHVSRVYITLGATTSGENEETSKDLMLVRRLLKLSPKTKTYEVVYGQSALRGERIPMVTRSVLGILTDLGAQVDVPKELVEHGSTKPTIGLIGVETRPTIVVHVGKKPPEDAYIDIQYGPSQYWIDRGDFDSKYAFTVVQMLMALAESNQDAKTPIVTIPAN